MQSSLSQQPSNVGLTRSKRLKQRLWPTNTSVPSSSPHGHHDVSELQELARQTQVCIVAPEPEVPASGILYAMEHVGSHVSNASVLEHRPYSRLAYDAKVRRLLQFY